VPMKKPVFRSRDTQRARQLRKASSPAERRLWQHIRTGTLAAYNFTRQYEIGPYHVDVMCRSKKLAIEIDGYSHDVQSKQDHVRDIFLKNLGYAILRVSNADVFQNIEGVYSLIEKTLSELPSPSPSRRREGS
jgi:very-short-patch-repair endonuclease